MAISRAVKYVLVSDTANVIRENKKDLHLQGWEEASEVSFLFVVTIRDSEFGRTKTSSAP